MAKFFLYFGLILISVAFFLWRWEAVTAPPPFENLVNQKVQIVGFVAAYPDRRLDKTLLTLETKNPKTRILLSTNIFSSYHYGDVLSVKGVLKKPENFETDLGKTFDYKNYLASQGIYYRLTPNEINLLPGRGGNWLKRNLFALREIFEKKIEKVLPFEKANLLSGILLGNQSGLPKETKDNFIKTSLIHIVVLSGYNITIVIETIMRILAFLSQKKKIFLGSLIAFLFIIMTGAAPPTVRAGIMAGLAMLGRVLGRPYDALRALFVAALIMLFVNPLIIYDPGFILSILATFALIYLTPKVEPFFNFLPEKIGFIELRELLSATLTVQIFIFPYLIYKMGMVSLVGPLTNLLVLPIVPATMFLGFLSAAAGFLSYFIAFPFAVLASLFLGFILWVASFFASLPFAVIQARAFPLWLVLLLYAAFLFLAIRKDLAKKINSVKIK